MSEEINSHRRRFLGTAVAIATARFGAFDSLTASTHDSQTALADQGSLPDLAELSAGSTPLR